MAVTTTTSLANVLKYKYLERLVNQVVKNSTMYELVKRKVTKVQYGGKNFIVQTIEDASQGSGWRSGVSAALPTAVSLTPQEITYGIFQYYHRLQVDWLADEVWRDDPRGYANARALEMKNAEATIITDLDHAMMGRGDGLLATNAGTATGTTMTVDNGVALKKNMRIDIRVKSSGSVLATGGDSNTISSVSGTNGVTVVLGTGISAPDTTYGVYREDSRNNAMYGIDAIADDADPGNGVTDLGGIDRDAAANNYWNAQVLSSSSNRPLSEVLLQEGFDKVAINGSGGVPDVLVMNHAIGRRYAYLLLPDRRFSGGNQPLKKANGGWSGLEFNGTPLLLNKFAKANTVYGLTLDDLLIMHTRDFHWVDDDGSKVSRVADVAANESCLRYFCNFGATKCHNHFRIEAVLES